MKLHEFMRRLFEFGNLDVNFLNFEGVEWRAFWALELAGAGFLFAGCSVGARRPAA